MMSRRIFAYSWAATAAWLVSNTSRADPISDVLVAIARAPCWNEDRGCHVFPGAQHRASRNHSEE